MVGFYLIAGEHKKIISGRCITPRSIEGFLEIGCIGLRRNSFPGLISIGYISIVYNIEGDTHNPPRTKWWSPIKEETSNVLESTTVKFRIPLDPMFPPLLSIFIYDNYLGSFAQRALHLLHLKYLLFYYTNMSIWGLWVWLGNRQSTLERRNICDSGKGARNN